MRACCKGVGAEQVMMNELCVARIEQVINQELVVCIYKDAAMDCPGILSDQVTVVRDLCIVRLCIVP